MIIVCLKQTHDNQKPKLRMYTLFVLKMRKITVRVPKVVFRAIYTYTIVWMLLLALLCLMIGITGCRTEPIDHSDREAPVIVIVEPLPDKYYIQTIDIQARAGDNSGLKSVTISIEDKPSDDSVEPILVLEPIEMTPSTLNENDYSYSWNSINPPIPDSEYTIRCRAEDVVGLSNEDEISILITNENPGLALGDTIKPTITFSKPYSSESTYVDDEDTWVNRTVWFKGTARDNVGIEKIEMKVTEVSSETTTLLGEATAAGINGWEFLWDTTTMEDGTYLVTVEATDAASLTGTSSLELIVDNTPPTITIIQPEENAIMGDDENPHDRNFELLVEGKAEDIHDIEKVEIQVDGGEFLWAELSEDQTTETIGDYDWIYSMDPTELSMGTHTITVSAVDNLGNVGLQEVQIETPVYVSVFTGDGNMGTQEGGPPWPGYPGTKARFSQVRALAMAPTGDYLYALDNGILRKIILSNGYVFNVNVIGLQGSAMYGLAVNADYAFASNDSFAHISRMTIISGQIEDAWLPLDDPQTYLGMGVVLVGDTLYTITKNSGNILKMDINYPENGYEYTSALPVTNPQGLATNGSYLYISTFDQYRVYQVNLTDETVGILAGAPAPGDADGTGTHARFQSMMQIAADDTYAYVCQTNHVIRRIHLTTREVVTLAGIPGSPGSVDGVGSVARFNNPIGIAVYENNLYVSDANNRCIRRLTNFQ